MEDALGLSDYGDIGALESIYLNTMGAKKGLDPYDLQTYESIIGQYKPVGGMYPGGRHELVAPRTRFKQQQIMNRRKQQMQKTIRQAEAAEAAKKKKITTGGPPSITQKKNVITTGGPPSITQKKKKKWTPPQQTGGSTGLHGGGGRPRPDKPGGFTDPGKGSYGPHKADGGLINYFKYGGYLG